MAMKMLTEETAKQAAEELGIKRADPVQVFARKFRLYHANKEGGWPARKDGRYWFFDVEEIKNLRETPGT